MTIIQPVAKDLTGVRIHIHSSFLPVMEYAHVKIPHIFYVWISISD